MAECLTQEAETASPVIASRPALTGVFGFPIAHSLSLEMHNAAFKHLGLDYIYSAHAIHPQRLKQAVEGIRALGYRGVNVTIPHKVAVMNWLDELDEEAAEIGAVNTIVCKDGRLLGYNTDGKGYVRSFEEELGIGFEGSRVLLVGAGGAGRAVAVSLMRERVSELHIVDQREETAASLARDLSNQHLSHGIRVKALSYDEICRMGLSGMDILINATPVGLFPHMDEMPISANLLHAGLIVSDLIYNPHETALLKAARDIGARVHHGIGMLIHQGALSFELWTGRPAPIDIMRKTVMSHLA